MFVMVLGLKHGKISVFLQFLQNNLEFFRFYLYICKTKPSLNDKTMKKTIPVNGKFELITLPYSHTALEPVISAETIRYHYGKHLLTYVNNLNAALPGSGLETFALEDLVLKARGAMLNNAGQVLNHNLYFTQFALPKADNAPDGLLAAAFEKDFGSFAAFKEAFAKAGATLFGSGWVWLSADDCGKLVITQEPNASNPIQRGLRPLMTMDVWEHAYYLDYQNRRPDHLAALWQIIDWDVVAMRWGR